ncbi:hypothetical protein VCSRO56_0639 [Vibrio cholerae]|nr:hypothetical protein VCSRO56_0639 [Vibrio cholerae]
MWRPIWSCSGWSLPCYELLPVARCALTAPFHPYLIPSRRRGHRRFALCCTCRRLAPPQALPGTLLYGARTFLPLISLPGDRPRDVNKAATTQSTPRRIVARSVSRVQKQSVSASNLGLTAYFAFNWESKAKKNRCKQRFLQSNTF